MRGKSHKNKKETAKIRESLFTLVDKASGL